MDVATRRYFVKDNPVAISVQFASAQFMNLRGDLIGFVLAKLKLMRCSSASGLGIAFIAVKCRQSTQFLRVHLSNIDPQQHRCADRPDVQKL